MGINECVMCANFGDPRSCDREWDSKKHKQMWFVAWKFINSRITQKPLGKHSWNLYTMWVIINGSCKPSLGTPGHVTKMLGLKMGRKLMSLNRYISVNTDFDEKWFVVFEPLSTAFLLVMFIYPNLNTIFVLFFLFFFLFSRYLLLIAKRIVFKVWAIEDIRKD